jgi:hypothetical protein
MVTFRMKIKPIQWKEVDSIYYYGIVGFVGDEKDNLVIANIMLSRNTPVLPMGSPTSLVYHSCSEIEINNDSIEQTKQWLEDYYVEYVMIFLE